MTILANSYIHLFFSNAKQNTTFDAKRRITNFGREKFAKILKQKYSPVLDLQNYKEFINGNIEKALKQTIENIDTKDNLSTAIRSQDIEVLKSAISQWASQAPEIQEELEKLGEDVDTFDKIKKVIEESVTYFALESKDPFWIKLAGLQDGKYMIPDRMTHNVETALGKNSIKTSEDLKQSSGVAKAAGWLFEAEILKGALQAKYQGNQSFSVIPTTVYKKTSDNMQIIVDQKLQDEAQQSKQLIEQMNNILKSIKVGTEKADFYFLTDSFYSGVSVKNTQIKKDGTYKYNIGLGSAGANTNLLDILKSSEMQEIGSGKALPTLVQSAFSIGIWSKREKPVKNILNIAGTLLLADSLVGELKDFSKSGYTGYLVVNKKIYRTPEILQAAITGIEKRSQSGAEISQFQRSSILGKGILTAMERWNKYDTEHKREGSDYIWEKAEAYLSLQKIKVQIDLNYLISLGLNSI